MNASRTLAILLIALVGAAALGDAAAQAPAIREEDDKLVLTNDTIAVWFADGRPTLTVIRASDLLGANGYEYRYTDVVEYRDVDGNGAPGDTEIVARLQLSDANWSVQRVETDERASLNFTLESPVELGLLPAQNVTLSDRVANVSLVFTLGGPTASTNAVDVDFVVAQWPFVDADNRLALQSFATGTIELDETNETVTAALTSNETALGNVTWDTMAQGVGENGTAVDVPVVPAIALASENESLVVLTYDATGITGLTHRASLAIPGPAVAAESTAAKGLTVPGPGLLLGVAALAAVGLLRRRG